jgi:(S)-mandelate dehydrogenase
MGDPNRHDSLVTAESTPQRRFYTGGNLARVKAIDDLRARTHKLMPRIALEYLEGGAEDEATLARERQAYAEWRFMPRQLVDVSYRTLESPILGQTAKAPLIVAPTGLNGLFRKGADIELAQGATAAGFPFTQSTMSNERMEDVAKAPGLRHWWQLYVFGGDEIWQELLRRADACGVEALVLTTNSQIYGDREWDDRLRYGQNLPSLSTALDAALHPSWLAGAMGAQHGMPQFKNVIDFVPKDKRGFFESAYWIREQMPKDLTWKDVEKIRQRWTRPFLIKGLLNLDDVRRAMDAGVDGVILGAHGGRQADWAVSALDLLPRAREIARGGLQLMMSGGIRRGTDILKALCLGADAILAGRAPLYGLCAYGAEGVEKALDILHKEAIDDMGQMGAASRQDLTPALLVSTSRVAHPGGAPAAQSAL